MNEFDIVQIKKLILHAETISSAIADELDKKDIPADVSGLAFALLLVTSASALGSEPKDFENLLKFIRSLFRDNYEATHKCHL